MVAMANKPSVVVGRMILLLVLFGILIDVKAFALYRLQDIRTRSVHPSALNALLVSMLTFMTDVVKPSAQLVNIFQIAPVFLASPATDALVT